MSFSSTVKEEILNLKPESDCCALASICACINSIGSLEINKKGVSFSLKTDNMKLLEYVRDLINLIYSSKIENLNTEEIIIGRCKIRYLPAFIQ